MQPRKIVSSKRSESQHWFQTSEVLTPGASKDPFPCSVWAEEDFLPTNVSQVVQLVLTNSLLLTDLFLSSTSYSFTIQLRQPERRDFGNAKALWKAQITPTNSKGPNHRSKLYERHRVSLSWRAQTLALPPQFYWQGPINGLSSDWIASRTRSSRFSLIDTCTCTARNCRHRRRLRTTNQE